MSTKESGCKERSPCPVCGDKRPFGKITCGKADCQFEYNLGDMTL